MEILTKLESEITNISQFKVRSCNYILSRSYLLHPGQHCGLAEEGGGPPGDLQHSHLPPPRHSRLLQAVPRGARHQGQTAPHLAIPSLPLPHLGPAEAAHLVVPQEDHQGREEAGAAQAEEGEDP